METTALGYPVEVSIDYPAEGLNRFTTFFRLITIIPIVVVFGLLSGIQCFPLLLLILFRGKYPRWWFDWNVALVKFWGRVGAYLLLLRDEYPSTDEEQAVHIEIPYPEVSEELNRGLPLVKWLLAVPHYIVLALLYVAVAAVWVLSWFAILFTGRYPRGMFSFVVGVIRWSVRVGAYACLLVTDKYPPFRLSE